MLLTKSSSCRLLLQSREWTDTIAVSYVVLLLRHPWREPFRHPHSTKFSSVLDWTPGAPIIVIADCNILFSQSWRVPIRCGETRIHPLVHSRSISCHQEHFEGESSSTPDARLSSCASGAT